MSKTNKKREEELALSKNNGSSIRYRKRLVEEQEALEELERELQRSNDEQAMLYIPNVNTTL